MPEISRFYGIVIKMFFGDHEPPHLHAIYGEYEAIIGIQRLGIIAGELPPRAYGLVVEWASQHHDELMIAWQHAEDLQSIGRIDPLP